MDRRARAIANQSELSTTNPVAGRDAMNNKLIAGNPAATLNAYALEIHADLMLIGAKVCVPP
jgi:hypothetical protein